MDQLKQILPPEVYEILLQENIKSPKTVVECSKTDLAQMTKLDPVSLERVIKECVAIVLAEKCTPGHLLESWKHITTGCPALDLITRGGIPINGITEIVGCSGVGKTQMCLQLALMAQLPVEKEGLQKSVVYICTEDVFPSKRMRQLSEEASKKYKVPNLFEDNIFIEHISDIEQLRQCIFANLPKLLSVKTVGLVVIDSIAGPFRSENENVDYFNRSRAFVSLAVKLHELSEKHGFAVVCTNQVTQNVESNATEPCLGLAWSNIVTCRLSVTRRFTNQVREVEIIFAPDLPNESCRFKIAKEGIVEVSGGI